MLMAREGMKLVGSQFILQVLMSVIRLDLGASTAYHSTYSLGFAATLLRRLQAAAPIPYYKLRSNGATHQCGPIRSITVVRLPRRRRWPLGLCAEAMVEQGMKNQFAFFARGDDCVGMCFLFL